MLAATSIGYFGYAALTCLRLVPAECRGYLCGQLLHLRRLRGRPYG
jgi:hypothetical protein